MEDAKNKLLWFNKEVLSEFKTSNKTSLIVQI